MRHTLVALTLILGISGHAYAQGLLRVEITDGQFRAGMFPTTTRYTAGAPWAAVPATAVKRGADPTVAEFRIRSWIEGEGARVLVFAVTPSSAGREPREQQIASVVVRVDQTVEITATEKYNARRVTLSANRLRSVMPGSSTDPRVPAYHGIDIPIQPWRPSPRGR